MPKRRAGERVSLDRLQPLWYVCRVVVLLAFAVLPRPSTIGSVPSLLVNTSSTPADSSLSATTVEGRLAIFDDVWQTIYDRYYDPYFNGVDWEQQRTGFRPMAAAATGSTGLYDLISQMLAPLRDPHTRARAPEENTDWRTPLFISVGLKVQTVESSIVVTEIDRDSGAARSGIAVGDTIVSVDGRPPGDEHFAQGRSVTPSFRSTYVLPRNPFDGKAGTMARIAWRDRNNRESTMYLMRDLRSRSPALEIKSAPKGFSIVVFDSFTEAVVTDLQQAIAEKLRHKKGLIIDLRNNGGGDAGSMAAAASLFLRPDSKLGTFFDREGRPNLELRTGVNNQFNAHPIERYNGPIVLLTSRRTASAAEIFVSALSENGRSEVIGEQTCGCVLAVRSTHSLPDGGGLDVSELDYKTPAGLRLEGKGIVPIVLVSPAISDIRARHDTALKAALNRLRTARKQPAALTASPSY
jgi:carboxyl-terminal processing protease